MDNTKIEWCDSTWNPVTGCKHGCEYCYARKIASRFGCHKTANQAEEYELDEPYKVDGNRVPYPFDFAPTLHRYRLGEYEKKESRTIFVCSMADLFGDWVSDSWIEEVFEACEKAPQHRYLFLTKNPERYSSLANNKKLPQRDNMWYGTSVTKNGDAYFCSQDHNTFLSIEPLLEERVIGFDDAARADWIIIGAETGSRKDKVVPKPEWIDRISKMSALVGTPVFMKDSLIPIIGEENMRRGFPWET